MGNSTENGLGKGAAVPTPPFLPPTCRHGPKGGLDPGYPPWLPLRKTSRKEGTQRDTKGSARAGAGEGAAGKMMWAEDGVNRAVNREFTGTWAIYFRHGH